MARILLVEDSPTQVQQLQYILQSHGFDVEVALDGQTALKRLENSPFDLVLSDIIMPGLSGYELCSKIKAGVARDVPVILLTSLNEPADILEGLVCGADNFITKPFEEDYLLGRIQNVLANKRSRTERYVDFGVEIQFMGKRLTINSDRQQILDLLVSALEEVHRSKQSERELKSLGEKQRQEADTLRLRERRVRKDWEELRAIVETIPTAVAIACPDGEIHFANRAFFSIGGTGSCKTLDEWIRGIVANDPFGQELKRHLKEALEHSGRVARLEAGLRLSDGRQLDWVMHLQRLRAEINGKPTVMVAGVDVTDQKRLIVQLSNARSQMEDFLAAAAHDLKAPLITIGHNITFARKGVGPDVSPDVAKCLDRVQSAARDMLALLGQVSAVSNAGRDTEPRLKHASRELIQSALRQLDGMIVQRQANVSVQEPFPEICCQETKLIQVFTNLISNAIKYTPADCAPVIELGCAEHAAEYVFFVKDHGVGIPQKAREEIFELFRRLSTDPAVEGQGVGLTIVKRIVEVHGGRVWVDSVPGKGSTFYFTIPRWLQHGKGQQEVVRPYRPADKSTRSGDTCFPALASERAAFLGPVTAETAAMNP